MKIRRSLNSHLSLIITLIPQFLYLWKIRELRSKNKYGKPIKQFCKASFLPSNEIHFSHSFRGVKGALSEVICSEHEFRLLLAIKQASQQNGNPCINEKVVHYNEFPERLTFTRSSKVSFPWCITTFSPRFLIV